MAKEKKIGVNFFLNERLKPSVIDGQERYPVYVRITFDRKNHQTYFPLRYFDGNLSKDEYKRFVILRQNPEINSQLENYEAKVSKIIRAEYIRFNGYVSLRKFSERMLYYETPLLDVLEKNVKNDLVSKLNEQLNQEEMQQINNEYFSLWDVYSVVNDSFQDAFKKVISQHDLQISLKSYVYLSGYLGKLDSKPDEFVKVLEWLEDLPIKFKNFLLKHSPIDSEDKKQQLGFFRNESKDSPVRKLLSYLDIQKTDISLIIKSIDEDLIFK